MIIGGMATIPQREATLQRVVDSIFPQVDELYVAFNDYKEFPAWLVEYPENLHFFLTEKDNKGDAEKFRFVDMFEDAYYISWDDDLVCGKGVISKLVIKCSIYNATVGYHGKVFDTYPVLDYHKGFTENYRCLNTVSGDHYVDAIGSGCTCFDTSLLKLSIDDFKSRNMADLWLSLACAKQRIKMIVIDHSCRELQYIPQKETIWRNKKRDGEETRVINEILSIKREG